MKKNVIIFDLGGVLLNIDYDAPVKAFKKLGLSEFDKYFKQAAQSGFFDEFEKGKMTNAQFRDTIRDLTRTNITDDEIDNAWNSILLNMPEEKMHLLSELSMNYTLILLSNTNNIHIPIFEKSIAEKYGDGKFHSFFDKIYYSSQIGLRKPDGEIFEFVLKDNNLKAEEIFFIDDSIQHVNGAKGLGIKAFHLDLKKDDLNSLLKRIRII